MGKRAKQQSEQLESPEALVYKNAFSFIMGGIPKIEALQKIHALPIFKNVVVSDLYVRAEETCRQVLELRKTNASTLAAFLDARLMACQIVDPLAEKLESESNELSQSVQNQLTDMVFSFVQARCSIADVKTGFDALLMHKHCNAASENVFLGFMEQARRDILLETAQMLTRCQTLSAVTGAK